MKITLTISLTMLLGFAVTILPACSLKAQTGNGQLQITNGPVIEIADDNSATIAWSTNAPSSSRVWYGTDKNNLTQFAESGYSAGNHSSRSAHEPKTRHDVLLRGRIGPGPQGERRGGT